MTDSSKTVSAYIQEAVVLMREVDVSKLHLKDIYDAVKDSEDAIGVSLADFKSAVLAEYDYAKVQEKIDKLQAGINIIDGLKGN